MSDDSPMRVLDQRVFALLSGFSEFCQNHYGVVVAQLTPIVKGGASAVTGWVAVPKQLGWLRISAEEAGIGNLPLDIRVLSTAEEIDADTQLPRLDHPGSAPLPLQGSPTGGVLQTEWLVEDGPARVLYGAHDDAARLVQVRDGSVAWLLDTPGLHRTPRGDEIPFVRALTPGAQATIDQLAMANVLAAAGQMAARGVAYRLGGRWPATGLDCSSFVQLLFNRAAGVLLPRHSGDQMQVGQRVSRSDWEPGDLVFARALKRNVGHVGLLVNDAEVAHACPLDGRVRLESTESFLQRYRLSRAQRVLRVAAVAT